MRQHRAFLVAIAVAAAWVLLQAEPALAGGGGGGGGVRAVSVPWISLGFLATLQLGVAVWWWRRRRP